jgi:magnesium transporter
MPAVKAILSAADGTPTANGATAADIGTAVASGKFFWLDLDTGGPTAQEAYDVLGNVLHLHELAIEDAEHFGQRPKIDDFPTYSYVVVHGAGPDATATEEVHIIVSTNWVVTIHHGTCPALADVRMHVARRRAANEHAPPQLVVLYFIVDGLTDTFFPVLSQFDDAIDDLASAILAQPTEAQLGEIFDMKRKLLSIRKVITPQRDMFARITSGITDLPGLTDESVRYFRDLYDHLIRISDMVDGYRDLVSGVMDTHLSTVSNRLNVVMKQLAIIATVFLPLSFLTGFFGQNFSWLVTHLGGWPTFVGVGIGTEVIAVMLLMVLFKRRGWMGGPSA